MQGMSEHALRYKVNPPAPENQVSDGKGVDSPSLLAGNLGKICRSSGSPRGRFWPV
jgi:hypothetical protein